MNARKWDVESYLHVQPTGGDPPLCYHGRLRLIVHDDCSWIISVKRDDATFDLLLQGKPDAPFGATMREILSWLFGVTA